MTLPRLNIDNYFAITWTDSVFGTSTFNAKGWQFLRGAMEGLTDRFLNDYLRDNPKN